MMIHQKQINMINSVRNRFYYNPVVIRPSYTKLKRVQVEKDGYVRTEIQYVEYDCGELSRGKKPLDFSIVNLLAVGAYNQDKPSYLRSTSDFSFIDKFENHINATKQD